MSVKLVSRRKYCSTTFVLHEYTLILLDCVRSRLNQTVLYLRGVQSGCLLPATCRDKFDFLEKKKKKNSSETCFDSCLATDS